MLRKVRGVSIITLLIITIILIPLAYPLEIISPKEGETIQSGQVITVKVAASPGERIERVVIGGDKVKNFDMAQAPSFEGKLFIPPEVLGKVIITAVGARNQDGSLPGTEKVTILIT